VIFERSGDGVTVLFRGAAQEKPGVIHLDRPSGKRLRAIRRAPPVARSKNKHLHS
jgi:hypothetical protein